MVVNITELTINAMFYVFFVVFSGGLALVTVFLIGHRLFVRQREKMAQKSAVRHKKQRVGV